MQKSVIIFVILCAIVSAKTLPDTKKTPTLITYEKLRKSPNDLRLVTTLSILNGALKAEEKMELRLRKMAREFYATAPKSSKEENLRRIGQIEKSMARDRRAIAMLGAALDLSKTNSSVDDYRRTIQRAVRNIEASPPPNKEIFSDNVTQQINALKNYIDAHLTKMHATLEEKGKEIMKYLKAQERKILANVKKEEKKTTITTNPPITTISPITIKPPNVLIPVTTGQGPYAGTFVSYVPISNPPIFFTVNGLSDFTQSPDDFIAPYVARSRRQDDKTSEESSNAIENSSNDNKNSNSELSLSDEDSDDDARPGGLVGLIASLSGGDEGSDVGALLGALTGVVTNLFGPGGLDIPSLLSSGTSLLAGLLGGDDNFGKVLAGYVVTAIDGFSGGGAADPENEEGPPNPGLFIKNFFKGFHEGKRRGGDEGDEEEKEDDHSGSAGFFNFISNFVSSIAGGITSFILNASLGSSGGSSQGVADLSGSSSSASSSGSH
ncbi:uncharacterized protein LOC129789224 [Lutzomyia longipalpis]|uniref:uncharacterized protein LOC129789224 n=1 Tax=Lutzomyia longipalpis TaxID=7200 RepID=UPI0024844172|nr:uncharacterized protein LOC129789224 [Lutzomyia longipalpis]